MGWLLTNDTVGIVTWVGTIVAVIGLPATSRQARSARIAARASGAAAKALEDRLSLANLSFAYSQIESIRTLVASGELKAAQVMVGSVKRTVIEVCGLHSAGAGISTKVEFARKKPAGSRISDRASCGWLRAT